MIGRIVSLIFSVLTVYGLYLLVRKIINEQTSLWSAFIYAVLPLNIFYGRAFMPESAMLMCSVYAIYFFSEWLDKEKAKYFVCAAMFTSLAALIKLPSLYLGLPLLYLAFQKYRFAQFKNWKLYLLAVLIVTPAVLWYYHAHQLLLNGGVSFGIWTYGQDKWGMFSLLINPSWYNDIFLKSFAERHVTYAGFVLFLWGIFIKREHQREKLFDWWLIAVLVYIFIAAQAHRAQEYYTLPIDLPASVFIGKVLAKYLPMEKLKEAFKSSKLKSTFALVCLLLVCVLSYLRVARILNGESWNSPVLKIADAVKKETAPDDLIITVSDGNPVYLYQSHRRGWTMTNEQAKGPEVLFELKNKGAKWITGEWKNPPSREKPTIPFGKYVKAEYDYYLIKLD
jgi:4-amino-4-deoxy-L-arabinose transferase-like glycosyltransferase